VIATGNLSAGGTGKSPMTEYLIRLLHTKYSLATLSRGYKRKTRGFLLADEYTGVQEIGDEPYQMYLKYKSVAKIAVGEERSIAIPNILLEHPETQVILMDDGYQHRTVSPDFNILLTDYSYLFTDDHLLPWGRLREPRSGAKRAQAIIVTKCPHVLDEIEQQQISSRINAYIAEATPIFFSSICYGKPVSLNGRPDLPLKVLGFAGLANTELFEQYLNDKFELVEMISYADHHFYSNDEITQLVKKARATGSALITTEKDIVKFRSKDKIQIIGDMPLFYIAIEHQFVKDGNVFDKLIFDAISEKYKPEEE